MLRPGVGGALVLGLTLVPASAQGQLGQVLQAVANGGSWIRFSVEAGQGAYRSARLPVAGMTLDGCFQVWEGHSGSWTIRAKDLRGTTDIDVTVAPGEPVEFSYEGSLTAEIDVQIEWSEARDTTLIAWVGLSALAGDEGERDICRPPPAQPQASASGQPPRRPIAASSVSSSSAWVPHRTAAPAAMITDG